MVRRKRHYESTRIKLDMSFEDALARLCNATWPPEHDGEQVGEPSTASDAPAHKKKQKKKSA
ncbi:MAG: hypothetical protein JSW38_02605 [Dehalococcoidia bacterium]|nr:MAG: hypothetical protein JSV02_09310 [Dehalococcoidia bacterium]UCG83724.1 MAG: hypothetical protein JSW38_02605 [Dehalococcoidia bacterium]